MTLVGVTSSGLVIKRKLSGTTESILFEKLHLTRARLHYKILTDSGIETKFINIKIKPQFNSLRSLPIDDPDCPLCFVSLGETTRIYHPITGGDGYDISWSNKLWVGD